MNDLIRSGIYTGIGSLVLAKKKLEELIEELIQNNELTQDEGQRIIHDVIHKMEDGRNDLEHRLIGAVDELLFFLKMPGRNEIDVKLSEWIKHLRKLSLRELFADDTQNKPLVK